MKKNEFGVGGIYTNGRGRFRIVLEKYEDRVCNAIHSLRTDADKHFSVWGNRPLHCGEEPLAKVEISDLQAG